MPNGKKTQKRKVFDNYLLDRSKESNMVRRFCFTFTPYEYNPQSQQIQRSNKFYNFSFSKIYEGQSHTIIIKLCNNYFLLSHSAKSLKIWSMRVTKTLLILIQRTQCLIVILTFKSHQNKKSINSMVASLMISLMICHFVFIIFTVVYDQSGWSITS